LIYKFVLLAHSLKSQISNGEGKDDVMQTAIALVGALLVIPAAVYAEDFESWDDHQVAMAKSRKRPLVESSESAKEKLQDEPVASLVSPRQHLTVSASQETATEEVEVGDYLIHFGAGASWLVPMAVLGDGGSDKVLSVFSASVAPFGLGEVGVDLALGRESEFFLQPNLKFYFLKGWHVSIYLEGLASIYSSSETTDVGGGAGMGIIGGLMDNLAFEIRANVAVHGLGGKPTGLAGVPAEGTDVADAGTSLVICPSVGARVLARF
jgi:hypothetical protein